MKRRSRRRSGSVGASALWGALVLLAPTLASAQVATPPEREDWSFAGLLRVAPLEGYPRAGIGLQAAHGLPMFGPRWHIGGGLDGYLPRTRGDVSRFATGANIHLQLAFVRTQTIRWYGLAGPALGLLRDDYLARSVFPDRVSIGAGVVVATGLEWKATPQLGVFVEPRAVSYRTKHAVDDEWLEIGIGVRFIPTARSGD